MYDLDVLRKKLSSAARVLAPLKRDVLDSQKAQYSDLKRDDFLWHYLIQSFATMGGVSGWDGLIGNDSNYQQMTFDALSEVPTAVRLEHA